MADSDIRAVSVPVTTLWETPDAVREVDRSTVADSPDARAWPDAMSHEQKLDLHGRVLSQLLLGEPVEVTEEQGGWAKVIATWQPSSRDPRGYPGWVRRAHLGPPPAAAEAEAVIAVETAPLHAGPGGRGVVTDVTYGTILPVLDNVAPEDSVRVGLPGGNSAWLDRSACVVRPALGEPDASDRAVEGRAVVAAARRFVGLEYLWGGTCAFGLDCSGLVHLAFRALGKVVPRDAHDQATAGKRLPRSDARPGDLLFYARPGKGIHHVGFALDHPERVLHAPGTGSKVVDEPMDADRTATMLDYVGRFTS